MKFHHLLKNDRFIKPVDLGIFNQKRCEQKMKLNINLRYYKMRIKWFIHDRIRYIIPRRYFCNFCKTKFWIFDRDAVNPQFCPSCGGKDLTPKFDYEKQKSGGYDI